MTDILSFVAAEQSYDPDTLNVMGAVFDRVHRQQPAMAPERVACAIFSVARKEMDADKLCAAVLKDLRKRH